MSASCQSGLFIARNDSLSRGVPPALLLVRLAVPAVRSHCHIVLTEVNSRLLQKTA
jgi:hypothetical protein